jgi:class 3 adenylate cyclase/tetratricopeptide (TPR) repeat protein
MQDMAPDPYLPYVSRVPLSWADSTGPAAHWLDGTLLFVDVAGFTALSERLSRQGRAGAEELTELLDGAFARLLSAAYDDGGSLLSFGGDALLLFFHGPDHERRAAHAAGVIKRKPAELGPLQTSVGAVRLRLSMGAHSGRFLFLVTGEDSRVVLLLGPDATATVRLEQRATAGQVCLGPSLAAAVPEASGPLVDGAALLLRTPKPPLVGDPDPAGEPLTDASRFLSPPLREHIAARPSSEHRRVAVGFVQVRGADALLARDTGTALLALDEVVVATQRAAAEYGVSLIGSDVDADGAKLILVAGAPKATEHEEERLLRACRTVLDLETPLTLRAGVTAGPVFVGDVGPAYRRAFTVMGERVNLAARLMASAEPGELRTTPKVLAASSTHFVTRQLEPLQLKGIREPVQAVAVGEPVGQVHGDVDDQLHGREEELAQLRDVLARAKAGTGSCIEVVGEAGVGKSALLAALVAEADCPTLRVAAAPYERETPYGLVKRILRHLLGVDAEADAREVGRRAAGQLTALNAQDLALVLVAADADLDGDGPASGPAVLDDLFLQRLSRAVRRALAILVPGPACLVVEDLHCSDASSVGLLRSVAESLAQTRWVLCTSRRPAGGSSGKAMLGRGAVVWLAPLDPTAATELVHALTADAPMTPHRVAALVARSGGNPLFLTELVRTSRDSDDLPESVEAVVNARLDALPTYLRTLLRQAAVLGAVFDLDLLGELAGFVPDREEWRLLEGLLERQGSRAAFASEMFRDVAYGSLLFRDRRVMHRTVGRALAARGSTDVELLALHASEAHDDELTWRYGVDAGRRAQARGAHEQAVTSYRRAVNAHARGRLGAAAETSPVQALLGDALVRAGRPHEALPAYRRARALSPRGPLGDPTLCHKEALARIELGQHAAARRWLSHGLKAADPARAEDLEILESQAGVQYRQGQYAGSLRTLEQLIAATEGTGHRRSNAHAHDLMHLVLTTIGDPRRAEHRTQALATYTDLGDIQGQAHALNNLGKDAYHECRWTEAVDLFERSRLCEEADANDVGAAISDANIAEVLLDQGSWEEAHRRCVRALRTFLADDFRLGMAEVLNHLGRLETRRGRWDEAAQHLQAAREATQEMGADSLLPDIVVREAELAAFRGDTEEADRLVGVLATTTEARAEIGLAVGWLRAVVAARRGLDAEAVDLLRRTIALGGAAAPFLTGLARHSLAVLLARSGDAESETHRLAAVDALRRLGVHQFRDPLAGDDLVVIALPDQVVDLAQVRQERTPAAV